MTVTKRQQHIVAGETRTDVWCVPCNANVAVRVQLHIGDLGQPVAAEITVCANCGNRFIPVTPQITLTQTPRQRTRWRPLLALAWRRYRRECARRGVPVRECALTGCPRPGWWDCAWYEAVEFGRIRWVFCGRRHRRQWLEDRDGMSDLADRVTG